MESHSQGAFPALAWRRMEMQDHYDDAMFDYTTGDYDSAIAKFQQILAAHAEHFDAQLAIAMSHYRKGDYAKAIEEGHKAEKLKPSEQLVHTNLSLFYMKSGDKKTAEHHGLQARLASWKGNMQKPDATPGEVEDELKMAQPKAAAPVKVPDMPWKKKPPIGGAAH
ncbi:MAG TPA: tetratricopeptide repeat protein [Methylomirabilota bacterium]|nr:tetratricopeptide repeat protein [Methylomirabilota bacterium]